MKKLYHFLYKIFYYETFIYEVALSKDSIIDRLNVLFREEKGIFQYPNLTGDFAGEESFWMTPKWSFMTIKGAFTNNPAVLKGIIRDTVNNRTRIEVAVRPNSIFFISFILVLLIGLFSLIMSLAYPGKNNSILSSFLILLFVLPIISWIAISASDGVRNSFEEYMNIEPLETGNAE